MSTSAEYIPGIAELGRKNQAGGYVGIDDSGDVLGTFAQRVDTAANLAAITLAAGELGYASDTQSLFVGDGATAGGIFLHQKPQVQSLALSGGAIVEPAITSTTLYFAGPKNSRHRLRIFAQFLSDSGNASNFAVTISIKGFWTSTKLPFNLTAQSNWFSYDGFTHLQTRADYSDAIAIANPAGKYYLVDVGNQSLAGAQVFIDAELRVANIASGGAAFGAYIAMVPRTGASSPATGTLNITSQRIA